MSPDLLTEQAPSPIGELEIGHVATIHFGRVLREGRSYNVVINAHRLRVRFERTDEGFVVDVPELNVFGYGESLPDAFLDLLDAVREYLLAIKDQELAPEIEHHARYVKLLDLPERNWFTLAVPDGADLE